MNASKLSAKWISIAQHMIGKTAEKLGPYVKGANIADAKRVTSTGEVK